LQFFTKKCRKYINQASIGLDFLKNALVILLPSIEEQQAIVQKTNQLMSWCDELEKKAQKREALHKKTELAEEYMLLFYINFQQKEYLYA